MAKNVLFLIHGVGKHGDDWATGAGGAVPTLKEASAQYPFFAGKNLENIIEFVPIRYDDIFDRILGHWANLAESLRTDAGAAGPQTVRTALDLLSEANDDTNVFLTHGGDVALYKGFELFAQRVQLRVISKIVETIAAKFREDASTSVRFNVLAHSLGTTVAHDALHLLGTEDWLRQGYQFNEDQAAAQSEQGTLDSSLENLRDRRERTSPLAPGEFRFDSLFMVSNTSSLLHTTNQSPTESIVRPGTDGHAPSYCSSYYNFDHKFDPISKVKRFQIPTQWKSFEGAIDIKNLDHFHAKNIHSLSHYLKHPQVHLHILTRLVNAYAPEEQDLTVLRSFPRFDGDFGDVAARLETVVRQAKQGRSLARLLEVLKDAGTIFNA